jgi:ketosteroid isomerase-like protein
VESLAAEAQRSALNSSRQEEKMKRLILITFLLTVSGPIVQSQNSAQTELALNQQQEQVAKVSRAFFEALRQGDASALETTVADDFQSIDSNGARVDKAALLFRAQNKRIEENGFLTRQLACSRLYGDTAVLIGKVAKRARTMPGQYRNEFAYTQVLVKREGRWQIIASQESRIVNN